MKLSKLTSAVILLVASNVNAAPITFNFEGTVGRCRMGLHLLLHSSKC